MTDRPIIFSAAMVRSLLAGRKTQTRRLATSPLTRVAPGDRLYVREHWKTSIGNDGVPPRELDRDTSILMLADGAVPTRLNLPPWGKHRQGMHMPRWASRLTLIVEGVKVEPLREIGDGDAIAEGIEQVGRYGGEPLWRNYSDGPTAAFACPIQSYRLLWESLHATDGQRWQDNPDVVALTFRVEHGNIDTLNLENARG